MTKNIILLLFVLCFTIHSAFAVTNNSLVVFGLMKTNFIVIDPLGRKTGYDIFAKQTYNEIPNSHYSLLGFGDSPNLINNEDDFYRFVVANGIDGKYIIKVIGNKLGAIQLDIGYTRPLGSPNPKHISYLSDVNKIDYFEINYSYATGMAGQVMPVIHIASSSTLIDDINVMQKMGYIGDVHFVSETIEKINKIEKERLEPQKPDEKSDKEKKKDSENKLTPVQKAKKEYQELLNEITEKFNKPEVNEFIKQEAYAVLKEDIEYIINHL